MVCAVVYLLKLAKVVKQQHHLPLTIQRPVDVLDHMAQMREQFAWQHGPVRAFSCSGPTQYRELFESFGKWVRVAHPDKACVTAKIQRRPVNIVSLFE